MSDNDKLKELLLNPSFKNWAMGKASSEEKEYWDRWILEDPAHRSLAKKAQQKITGFTIRLAEPPSKEQAWKQVQEKLDKDASDNLSPVMDTKRNASVNHRSSTNWRYKKKGLSPAYYVAAGFLLILVSSLMAILFVQDESGQPDRMIHHEVVTDFGERKTISFTDGTTVMLNGGTRLIYEINTDHAGAVNLFLEGEARFSVSERIAPDDLPFTVETEGGVIRVLGTRFVVRTRNNQTQVALEEGMVSVMPANGTREVILQPGQLAVFSSLDEEVEVRPVNLLVYTAWTNGKLYFEETPMEEVIERLEQTFGVKLVVRDTIFYDYKVSGAIEASNIEIITSALSRIFNVPIEASDSEEVIYIGENSSPNE